jgi:O-antigen/teichoic acid export membrane protein
VAASLDAYFENRFQHNLRNGIVNLLAFVVLLVIGGGYLWHGALGSGVLMLVLAALSVTTGVWDIWIYKRNLPRVAKQDRGSPSQAYIRGSRDQQTPPRSITEGTTKHLDGKSAG